MTQTAATRCARRKADSRSVDHGKSLKSSAEQHFGALAARGGARLRVLH